MSGAEIERWVHREPTGKYSRRIGFLYEWLTDRRLDFDGVTNGGYVDALEEDHYLTAAKTVRIPRWRVNDNLPGARTYCPTVYRFEQVKDAEALDIGSAWQELEREFTPDLLARSAVWLTFKESRASFAIEHEADKTDKIGRFAVALEKHVGAFEEPLFTENLIDLQRSILGDRATRYGLRMSPIFVGETDGAIEIVHYIGPQWELLPKMLQGLSECERRTRTRSSITRAAVLSFGFVYIHPLSDGNGRVSRFLINDVLRRDGRIPSPFVVPVSAVIAGDMRGYDRVLEHISKPFLRRCAGAYRFGANRKYPDGSTSNFEFDAYEQATPTWRYPDLTDHVLYVRDIVDATIRIEMPKEARQLRAFRGARSLVNQVIEGPDQDLDRIIRSVRQNNWSISGKLVAEFPVLAEPGTAAGVVEAVKRAFEDA